MLVALTYNINALARGGSTQRSADWIRIALVNERLASRDVQILT
jgi:hypothetical protein